MLERTLLVRSLLAEMAEDSLRAVALHQEAFGVSRELGFDEGIAVHLRSLVRLGHGPATEQPLTELSPDDVSAAASARTSAARAALATGDLDRAEVLYNDALGWYQRAGMSAGVASVREGLSKVAEARTGVLSR